jgi:parallel beta-helix repeat protein
MHRLRRFLPAMGVLIVLLALPTPASAAVNRYVATTGTDIGDCSVNPCQTLQYAIDQSFATDTIHVAAGMYTVAGLVTVPASKTGLTLLGANASVDARTRAVTSESILRNSQGMSVAASGVKIDGFTVQDSTNTAYTGYGIWLNPGVSGTQIVNDIFQNNVAGLGLANAGPSPALIQHNLFQNNNQGSVRSGIYTDEYVGGAVTNVLIDANSFKNNNNAGVGFSNTQTNNVGPDSNIEVSNNSFDRNGRGIYFYSTNRATVHDNSITNSTVPTDGGTSVAIGVFGGVNDLTILNNDLLNGALRGIRVINGLGTGFDNSDVEAHLNNIVGFPKTGNGAGLWVDAGGHVGPVNATCNWWGSPTGPTNPGNPAGTGDRVVGDAIFTPWLTGPAPTGPCSGIPNTPGKVTGGGQIQGDPIFSSLGALLSVPALIPSVADPSAQASFGFVAQCCAASGNLEYNDKPAGVRIKVQSVTGLNLRPGTCGLNTQHATFTGTASVIRSTGTTTETFTVDVDDCGEPGTADTFGITTSSYSNGPSVLIGGNIQIHKS